MATLHNTENDSYDHFSVILTGENKADKIAQKARKVKYLSVTHLN